MRQQINLYQPIFRQERKLFSAATVALACAVVLFAHVAIWLFGSYKVNRLDEEVARLRQQATTQEAMLATSAGLQAQRAKPLALEASIAQLTTEVAARSRALDVLRSGSFGEPNGFATRLEALARGHLEGVWLDRVVMSGAPGDRGNVQLEGATLDPDLVPRYLKSLASEPVLQGTRFAQFMIERPDEKSSDRPAPGIRFSARSAGLINIDKEAL